MINRQDTERDLSTTSLGKELNKTIPELRQQLLEKGLLAKKGRDWELTPNGSGD